MAEGAGFDLLCGAGRLGLQGAPGALPSALGFESPRKSKSGVPIWALRILARDKGFEPLTFWSVARRSIQLS